MMDIVAYCLKAAYIDEIGNTKIGYVAEPNLHNYEHIKHVSIIDKFYPYMVTFFSEEKYAKLRLPKIKEELKKHYNVFSLSIHEVCIKE